MKEYYLNRLHWIFTYTSRNFWYCLGKTLCIIVGAPLYAVSFAIEMIFTFINMLFAWIPVLNTLVTVLCKCVIALFGFTFYICILTDIRAYKNSLETEVDYEITDVGDADLPQMTDEGSDETSDTDKNI